MFCYKCGNELTNETSICPKCETSLEDNFKDSNNEKVVEIDQELISLSEEEHSLYEQAKKLNNQKQNLNRMLKKASKKNRKANSFKTKWNCLTALLLIFVLGFGIKIGLQIYQISIDNYCTQISILNQKAGKTFEKYEKIFISSINENRKASVSSNILSTSNKSTLDEYINSLYRHPAKKLELGTYKNKEYYLLTDAIIMDKYNLLDSSNNSIFPGAIIKGDSLFTDKCTVISAERTPIFLMSNQGNTKPVQISNPNYSNVTVILDDYAKKYSKDTAKEWEYNLQSVSASRELNASLGIGIENSNFNIGIKDETINSTIAINYSQTYYSISAEPLHSATDYFASGTDLQILGENEPAYVSSVDYGRKIILIVSSNMSQNDLSAKLNATISGVNISAGIENILKDEALKCQLISYGGKDVSPILNTSKENVGVIGDFKTWLWGDDENATGVGERLNAFLSEPGTFINPVPISYHLKYISDNSDVPAMYINTESIMLADSAQFVTLSLNSDNNTGISSGVAIRNNKDTTDMTIDVTNLPAILLNENDVTIQNGKANGSHFEFLWNSAYGIPITLAYHGREYLIDLAIYDINKKISIPVKFTESIGVGLPETIYKANVEIYKTNSTETIR